MRMRISVAGACLALAAAVSLVPAAQAQNYTYYIGGEAGWSSLTNQTDRAAGLPGLNKRFDDGFAAGARAGIEWGPWRLEEEYVYRSNDLDRATVNGIRINGATGSREAHAIMTNVLYDFSLGWPVIPHVGGGIGAVDIIDHGSAPGVGRVQNDDDWQFGYQAIAGVRWPVSPNLAVDLDYRYLATTDPTFRTATNPSVRYRSGYETHNLMASLVYRFGPPPVVAAPPIAPAPAPIANRRVFLVFFDWDRDTITPDGMQVIQQAAAAYKSGVPVRIQVTGYTDRSGSPGYNQRLSERRANNVANALGRNGVARNDMAVSGRGENDNRVPTANGVREPQNRRVEIVFP
jgi:OmpA-OmpF porin, OOP family